MLFSMIGESYELHGSRSTKHAGTMGSSMVLLLLVLLMNSGFPCSVSYLAEVSIMAHAMSCSVGIALAVAAVAGVLATVGLVAWMHLSMGRARLHTGMHLLTQGLALHMHTITLATLVVSTAAGSASMSTWSTYAV